MMRLEERIGTLEAYYSVVVSPLRERFSRYSFDKSKTVVCPLHDDNDPSLGVIVSRGKERFHCFGCGAWGTVVDFAERIKHRYPDAGIGSNIEKHIFDALGIEPIGGIGEERKEHPLVTRRRLIEKARKNFGVDDFREGVMDVVRGKEPVGKLDTLIVTSMMSSVVE